MDLAASAAKYCTKKAVNQSAASAASLEMGKGDWQTNFVIFNLIVADDGLGAPPWILGFLEAALAADLITA